MRFFLSSLLLILFSYSYSFAFINDSLKVYSDSCSRPSQQLYFYNELSFNDTVFYKVYNDSSLNFIHRYAFFKFGFEWHNGNIGLSRHSIFYRYTKRHFGFLLGINGFDEYFYSSDSFRIYFAKQPFTEISVVLGTQKEQIAQVFHTQNVNERWNFAFKMNRTSSEGFYSRQNANFNSIQLQSNYISKNKKYASIFQTNFNRANAYENGGIIDTSDVLNSPEFLNARGIPINLRNARRRVSENGFWYKQYFNITECDTFIKNDSLFKQRCMVKAGFSNKSGVTRRYTWFKDDEAADGFYPFFKDSITHDSIGVLNIFNEFKAHIYLKNLELNSGLNYEWNKIRMILYDTLAQNFTAVSELKLQNKLRINLNYVIWGFNKNDFRIKGIFNQNIHKNWGLNIEYLYDIRTPNLQALRWVSNNFEWNYSFTKEHYNQSALFIEQKQKNFKLGVSIHRFLYPVFYDFTARPKQSDAGSLIFQALLEKSFQIHKFYITNTLAYQKASNDSIFRIPQIITKNAFFYQTDLFKRAMQIQIGIDFYYFTAYTPYAYLGVTNVYYLQNNRFSGNYPFFDLFLNFKVKSLRGFVMLDHINQDILGNNQYYFMPGYPFPGRTVKVGLTWVFRD